MAYDVCPTCDQEVESFETYLRDNVMKLGTYQYEEVKTGNADVGVSEFGGGNGFICKKDLRRAVEDDNVEVWGIMDGVLQLRDARFD